MEKKFSIRSKVSIVAAPNSFSSASRRSGINLFSFFCVDAESEVEETNKVQLMAFAFAIPNDVAVARSFSNSREISSMADNAVPSLTSFSDITISFTTTPPIFFGF